ncbi:hypothetical protein ACFLZ4_01925 [Patescibacteria group bacterium]
MKLLKNSKIKGALITWWVTIFIFIIFILIDPFMSGRFDLTYIQRTTIQTFIYADIVVGVAAFIYIVSKMLERRPKKDKKEALKIDWRPVVAFIAVGILGVWAYANYTELKKTNELKEKELRLQEREISKGSYETPKVVPVIQQQNNPPSVVETDPFINCQSDKCEDRKVRRSICEVSTCCKVGDIWKWVESQSLCYQMQQDWKEKEEADSLKKRKEIKANQVYECKQDVRDSCDECIDGCKDIYGTDDGLLDCIDGCIEMRDMFFSTCEI